MHFVASWSLKAVSIEAFLSILFHLGTLPNFSYLAGERAPKPKKKTPETARGCNFQATAECALAIPRGLQK